MSRPGSEEALLAELQQSGDLQVLGPGRIAIAGQLRSVCEFFDTRFRRMARSLGAAEHDYPGLISTAELERLEFFSSFPHFATFAAPFESLNSGNAGAPRRERLAEPECAITPAVCYHTYTYLQDRAIPSQPYVVTARGRCCRFEGRSLQSTPARLWSFTMREIVFFGSQGEVERLRRRLSRAAARLAEECGLRYRLAPACDPFFLPESRAKALAQRLQDLKLELLVPLGSAGDIALASFNLHQEFFGARMKISLPDGAPAGSGCAAYGLERWGYAFLHQHGTNPGRWPGAVSRFVRRHGAG